MRTDIRISTYNNVFHDGIPLNMVINVVDINCNPIPNVIADVWHCDKNGVYSGYSQPGGNYIGHDFMRGIQLTNLQVRQTLLQVIPDVIRDGLPTFTSK